MNDHPDSDRALLEADLANADEAVEELRQQGFTHRRCLRCNGRLGVDDRGCGYTVYCETQNCLRLTFRGI
ncbi:hypothetical protein [Nannocystis pusilla]|uniref:hypothetical protein n=1 Tax=Nannocystis pusilla TaxID=889268 RepID=UPI003BF36D84